MGVSKSRIIFLTLLGMVIFFPLLPMIGPPDDYEDGEPSIEQVELLVGQLQQVVVGETAPPTYPGIITRAYAPTIPPGYYTVVIGEALDITQAIIDQLERTGQVVSEQLRQGIKHFSDTGKLNLSNMGLSVEKLDSILSMIKSSGLELKELDLSYNNLKELPAIFWELEKGLRRVSLQGNPLETTDRLQYLDHQDRYRRNSTIKTALLLSIVFVAVIAILILTGQEPSIGSAASDYGPPAALLGGASSCLHYRFGTRGNYQY